MKRVLAPGELNFAISFGEALNRWVTGSRRIIAGVEGGVCLYIAPCSAAGQPSYYWVRLSGQRVQDEVRNIRLFETPAEFATWLGGDSTIGTSVVAEADAPLPWPRAQSSWRCDGDKVLGGRDTVSRGVVLYVCDAQGSFRWVDLAGNLVTGVTDIHLFDTHAEFLKWGLTCCG